MNNLVKRIFCSKLKKYKSIYFSEFHKKPKVLSNEETIDMIINNKCSLGRFGDGEFFIMTKEKGLSNYQDINSELSNRLLEVMNSKDKNFLVGIPKIFDKKDLEFRTDASKEWWSNYLLDHRELWYKYIDFDNVYANTNFTRNYIAVKDKSICKEYFNNMKRIWKNRDILIVEGKYSRLGVGNDLFNNAKSIKRILAPNKNAFDRYDDILDSVKRESKDKLVLIALGPTATVLAYDLYKLGYQAIDIGHIDIEYEWFLQGVTKKMKVNNKYTYEAGNCINKDEFKSEEYESQIVSII